MLVRVLIMYAILTVCASAFHLNTYAVFELREQLLMLTINLWELLARLEYASDSLRQRVYLGMGMIQSAIRDTIAQLIELDARQHPTSE